MDLRVLGVGGDLPLRRDLCRAGGQLHDTSLGERLLGSPLDCGSKVCLLLRAASGSFSPHSRFAGRQSQLNFCSGLVA